MITFSLLAVVVLFGFVFEACLRWKFGDEKEDSSESKKKTMTNADNDDASAGVEDDPEPSATAVPQFDLFKEHELPDGPNGPSVVGTFHTGGASDTIWYIVGTSPGVGSEDFMADVPPGSRVLVHHGKPTHDEEMIEFLASIPQPKPRPQPLVGLPETDKATACVMICPPNALVNDRDTSDDDDMPELVD